MTDRTTYLLVDGENIDATLGISVLGRRPQPEERPRWNKLLHHAEVSWDQPVTGLFFLAVGDSLPSGFVQALIALGYKTIPLRGEGKVVDIAIQRTAEALASRPADVMLVSHDRDFVPQMQDLAATPERRTARSSRAPSRPASSSPARRSSTSATRTAGTSRTSATASATGSGS